MALSKDEITARALRLSGRAPNPYTGTLNDPFQEAQSAYAGPGWAQFFGGLQRDEEDANLAGQNFRVNWSGFGNARGEGGSVPRGRGPSLAAMNAGDLGDLNPLEQQAQKNFLLQQQANAAGEQAKMEKAAQKAYTDEEAQRVNDQLRKSYDDFVLSSTLAPSGTPTTITRTAGVTPFGEALQGKRTPDTITARPTPGYSSDELLRRTVPANMRLAVEKTLADMALKRQEAATAAAKETETARHNKATEAQSAPPVTADGIDLAANAYLTTGQMPPLGMGDKTTRQRILNRAGELQSAGTGSGSVAENKALYKADSGSLNKLQTQRDTIGAFEQTAMKNIDLFLDTAGKVVDTGSPLANTLVRQASGKLLGSPDQAQYDAARQVAINEIAKITSNPTLSGQLSDTARKEVEAFNPSGATLKQSVAVMRLLKQDMGNRTSSLDDQIALIKGRLKGGGSAPDKKTETPEERYDRLKKASGG